MRTGRPAVVRQQLERNVTLGALQLLGARIIASELGCSHTTVTNYAHRRGWCYSAGRGWNAARDIEGSDA